MCVSKVHFISGLPRSGSTLLAAILLQNRDLHASMSSPVAPLLHSVSQSLGIRNEWSPLIDGEQRRRILASLFHAYHGSDPEKDIIFDTSRAWCARLPLLAELFPDARIIACVRDPTWVINSFETIFRKNPFLMSRLFTADQSQTVYSRVDTLTAGEGAYGFASRALKEAYYGEHAHRLILLDYDALTGDPRGTMDQLYAELGLPPFDHDFENILYKGGDAFDAHFGLPGLHRVEPRVRSGTRRMVLPPDLAQRFANQDFWNRAQGGGPKVRAILSPRPSHAAG